MTWIDVAIYTIGLWVNGSLSVYLYKRNLRQRETRFLKAIQIEYPDSTLTWYSVQTTEAKAINQIKDMLREHRESHLSK